MKRRRKTPPRIPIEEFSVEIGDVNGKPIEEKRKRFKKKQSKK